MIIFLNGASSSGKTTIARSIQHLDSKSKFLCIGQDNFIKMMPYGMLGFSQFAKEGFFFKYINKPEIDPSVSVTVGDFGKKIIEATAKTACMLSDLGFNVIVDEVLIENSYLISYLKNLKNKPVYFVKVFCELKILLEREILRGDRSWGLAYNHFHSLHRPELIYDLEVNSSFSSSFELAETILKFTKNNLEPKGFLEMQKKLI